MSLICMPKIMIDLGCEMLYILDQRLQAQSIATDKSCKVLHDVVRTMFDPEYITKVFAPQELYTMKAIRQIFERLAHSSIMRLSESSMDKLFDLMLMGMKYQVYCSQRVEEMLEVSLLHIATVKRMVKAVNDPSVTKLVDDVEVKIKATYGGMSLGQQYMLRQTLQRFFLDKRVKVSLFLQEGIQSASGRLILPSPVGPKVGQVIYHTPSQSTTKLSGLKALETDPVEFFCHPAPFGSNLYDKDRVKATPPTRQFDKGVISAKPKAAESAGGAGEGLREGASMGGASAYAEEVEKTGAKAARKEIDLLGALMAMPNKSTQAADFKLNLFDDEGVFGNAGSIGGAPVGGGSSGGAVLQFGGVGKNEAYRREAGLAGVMKDMNLKDGGEEDLLALMDNA